MVKKDSLYCTINSTFTSDYHEEFHLTTELQIDFIGNIPKTAKMSIKVRVSERNIKEITESLKDRLVEYEAVKVDVTHNESTVTATMEAKGKNIKTALGYDGSTSYNGLKSGLEKQGYKCK